MFSNTQSVDLLQDEVYFVVDKEVNIPYNLRENQVYKT